MQTTALALLLALVPVASELPNRSDVISRHVRIVVAQENRVSRGSGVVICSAPNYTRILTNRHVVANYETSKLIVQDDEGDSNFFKGAKVLGVWRDWNDDLAVIDLDTGPAAGAAKLAPAGQPISGAVLTVGSDRGGPPIVWDAQIVRRFYSDKSHKNNFLISHPSVGGRSGGAVYDSNGLLIGLIYATNGQSTICVDLTKNTWLVPENRAASGIVYTTGGITTIPAKPKVAPKADSKKRFLFFYNSPQDRQKGEALGADVQDASTNSGAVYAAIWGVREFPMLIVVEPDNLGSYKEAARYVGGKIPFANQAASQVAQPAKPTAVIPLRLVPPDWERFYQSMLPKTEDPKLLALYNRHLTWYDDRSVIPAFQKWDGLLRGIHATHHNISGAPQEPFGNANMELPWRDPGGLDTVNRRTVRRARFMSLTGPIDIWRERLPRDADATVLWRYSEGTVFGELLTMTVDSKELPFELRLRALYGGRWVMDAYRPYATKDQFAEAVVNLAESEKAKSMTGDLMNLARWCVAAPKLRAAIKQDSNHPNRTGFSQRFYQDEIPPISERTAATLLDMPFVSAFAQSWLAVECHAPTASTKSIVPAGYSAAAIAVNNTSCTRCHESVLLHADDFDVRRDWYGRVRGGGIPVVRGESVAEAAKKKGGGIFTMHPFDAQCISFNGAGRGIIYRREMLAANALRFHQLRPD